MDFLTIMQAYLRGEKVEAALHIAPAGLVLVAVGGVVLVVDCFAERRAHPYVAALEALAVQHGVPVNAAE